MLEREYTVKVTESDVLLFEIDNKLKLVLSERLTIVRTSRWITHSLRNTEAPISLWLGTESVNFLVVINFLNTSYLIQYVINPSIS